MRKSSVILIVLAFFCGCTKEHREPRPDPNAFAPSGPPTFSTIQSDIFLLNCAVSGCHDNRATPAANINLTNYDSAYNGLVGKKSTQLGSMQIVEPTDVDNSYLVYKLEGTNLAIGGSGVQMPQYAASLRKGDRDRIVQWIIDGAQKN